jgi:hypothetical protein
VSSPWPDDWHQLINAVRDSGLFPQATIPDNASYALTCRTGSEFVCHWDGREKWGEYVISFSLGIWDIQLHFSMQLERLPSEWMRVEIGHLNRQFLCPTLTGLFPSQMTLTSH